MIVSVNNPVQKFSKKEAVFKGCTNVPNNAANLRPLQKDTIEISSSNQYRDITQNMLAQREKIKLSKVQCPMPTF